MVRLGQRNNKLERLGRVGAEDHFGPGFEVLVG
jgi:hypothetical protein